MKKALYGVALLSSMILTACTDGPEEPKFRALVAVALNSLHQYLHQVMVRYQFLMIYYLMVLLI